MRKLIGYTLIALPFAATFAFVGITAGILDLLVILAIVGAVMGCFVGGMYLATTSDVGHRT